MLANATYNQYAVKQNVVNITVVGLITELFQIFHTLSNTANRF